mgnify:CR=1 FL=1
MAEGHARMMSHNRPSPPPFPCRDTGFAALRQQGLFAGRLGAFDLIVTHDPLAQLSGLKNKVPGTPLRSPEEGEYQSVVAALESVLDRASEQFPQPGRTDSIRRLNRTEYQKAVRDFKNQYAQHVGPLIMANQRLGTDEVAGLPSFEFEEESAGEIFSRNFVSLIFLMLVSGVLLTLADKRIREIKGPNS